MIDTYDVVVIGAGSGGLTTAVGLRKVGKSVLLVEREHLGGECTNAGCIPSKALLHHAKQYANARFIAGDTLDTTAFRQQAFSYVRSRINTILEEETEERFKKLGIDVVLGEAQFVGKNEIQVENKLYHFKKAVIATGSSPRIIEVPGLDVQNVLTNQNLFAETEIPARVLILGGGPIGMEMGQALRLLGSSISIIEHGPVFAANEDLAIRTIIQKRFAELGITVHTNSHIKRVVGNIAEIEEKDPDTNSLKQVFVTFDKVLMAVGRVPTLPSGLDVAKVTYTNTGVTVNNNYLTSNRNVYALGDVANKLKFTHVADDAARQVITHIVSHGFIKVQTKNVPKVTYTDPEMAQVGLSQKEAEENYGIENIFRIEVPFSAVDRAITENNTTGRLVLIVKRLTGKILGAHIVGPHAGETIATITLAMEQNISIYKIRSTIFAYPTYSLVLKKAGDYFLAEQFKTLRQDVKARLLRTLPQLVVGVVWIIGVISLYRYQSMHYMRVTDTALMLFNFMTKTMWGPLLYIAAYSIRPVTFLPGTIFTIFSGIFFGLWGILYTIIGANLSAAVSYSLGRFFGTNLRPETSWLGKYVTAAREKPFMTIITMHLLFLPYDGVNYASGLLKLPFAPYIAATIIGTLLGITTFVSIGASISVEEFMKNGLSVGVIDERFLLLSVIIFIVSVLLSKKFAHKLS